MPEKTVAGTPADPTARFTRLELNGKSYSLVYDFDSIATAEDLTGLELLVGVNWAKINARRLRGMLYASLLKAHPEITLKDVAKLITPGNLPKIEKALVECWIASTPEREEESQNPQPPAAEA